VRILAVAGMTLRRFFRRRTNLFFVFVFPMVLVLLLGATFGGNNQTKIGVVSAGSGPLGTDLVRILGGMKKVKVVPYPSDAALSGAVERGEIEGGVIIPSGYSAALSANQDAVLRWIARPDQSGQQLGAVLQAAVDQQNGILAAARFAAERGTPFGQALATATKVAPSVAGVTVDETTAGKSVFAPNVTTYDVEASSELVLFVFLTSLAGSAALVESRRLGVTRRMLSTPTAAREVLAGLALGRFAVALIQGAFIVVGTAVLFGVGWGNVPGVAVLLVGVALAATGGGMLLGAIFRTEQQASSVSILVGLGLAALGGCMVPLQIFSDTMKRVAHLTPQAWAIDGFSALVRQGSRFSDMLPQLGVLLGFAAVLLALASWRLRRTITT